jgi:hypothetical protein
MGTCFIFSKQIKKGLSELKHWKMGEHPHNRQKKKKYNAKRKTPEQMTNPEKLEQRLSEWRIDSQLGSGKDSKGLKWSFSIIDEDMPFLFLFFSFFFYFFIFFKSRETWAKT